METLYEKGVIAHRDIEQVYEGLFMNAIASLENWIENLFFGLLTGRIKHPASLVSSRVSIKSNQIAREVTFGGRSYVDWLPYQKYTVNRAEVFFRQGLPFTKLDKRDKKNLEIFCTIRNAIAHKSTHSKKQFENEVIGSNPLPMKERTPAGYLRGIFRTAPSQTRYENLINEMILIINKLCI